MTEKIIAYLRLMRPANIITAIADILCGFAISGSIISFFTAEKFNYEVMQLSNLGWLLLSTIGLYGGGVVFNDFFDADLDKVERPERPIPSGLVSKSEVAIFASLLLLIGIGCAFQVNIWSGFIALIIAGLATLYDAVSKHHVFFGPLNMGTCRGGNLLLGISAIPIAIINYWFLALIPLIYISAITLISRGEVHGGKKLNLLIGMALYAQVILSILAFAFWNGNYFFYAILFLILFAYTIGKPLWNAIKKDGNPKSIMLAVKKGVISIIILDATVSSVFIGPAYALVMLLLMPLSIFLAKKFAVT